VNHDDYIGPGETGGIPEPPITGLTYGRGGGAWHAVLPLDNTQVNQVRGPILVPDGTQGVPGLMLGSNDSGFWRNSTIVYLNVSGALCMGWTPDLAVSWVALNMGNKRIVSLDDPAASMDAVNLRTLAGPWANFVPDPGWLSNTLRYRLLDGGKSLQFDGSIQAPLPANARARIGVLPEGARPARAQRWPAVAAVGVTMGAALMETASDGQLWTQWAIGDAPNLGTVSVSATFALD
jgi:hypothetical protein